MQSFSSCSTNAIKNKLASLRVFKKFSTLPPSGSSFIGSQELHVVLQVGQCFYTQALFPQLDHKKWKQSSFPPLQAEFSLMAELKSAMKRVQANELRPLHKGVQEGHDEAGDLCRDKETGGCGSSLLP